MPQSDRDYLLHVFKGNLDAVALVLAIARVADVWDNLIDADKPVTKKDVNDAFWTIASEIPRNPFYRAYMDDLLPVMETGILNWHVATEMERNMGNSRGLEIAHVIRYSIADVVLMVARICGGPEWAVQHGPELRLRSQRSDFKEYVDSLCESNFGQTKGECRAR